MTVRITIDPNVRVRGNKTYAGFEDIDQRGTLTAAGAGCPVAIGDTVLAVEPESGICADATVAGIDEERQFVYLAVDWRGWRDDPEALSS